MVRVSVRRWNHRDKLTRCVSRFLSLTVPHIILTTLPHSAIGSTEHLRPGLFLTRQLHPCADVTRQRIYMRGWRGFRERVRITTLSIHLFCHAIDPLFQNSTGPTGGQGLSQSAFKRCVSTDDGTNDVAVRVRSTMAPHTIRIGFNEQQSM